MFNLLTIYKYFEKKKLLKRFRQINILDVTFNEPDNIEDLILYTKYLNNPYIRRILKTNDVKIKTDLLFLDNLEQLLNTTSTLTYYSGHNYIECNSFYDERIFKKLDWYGLKDTNGNTLCIFNRNMSVKQLYSLIEFSEKLFVNKNSPFVSKIACWLYLSSLSLCTKKLSHYNTALANLKKLSTMNLNHNNLKTYGKSNLFWDEF